jgi:hypothetical protein
MAASMRSRRQMASGWAATRAAMSSLRRELIVAQRSGDIEPRRDIQRARLPECRFDLHQPERRWCEIVGQVLQLRRKLHNHREAAYGARIFL